MRFEVLPNGVIKSRPLVGLGGGGLVFVLWTARVLATFERSDVVVALLLFQIHEGMLVYQILLFLVQLCVFKLLQVLQNLFLFPVVLQLLALLVHLSVQLVVNGVE